jgi:DNA-directed RNA polymerase subunit K/omega
MVDLFLDPKVLNYSADKYQLILMTLRWARAMKAKGTPEPMPVLVEKALKDIVENKVTIEEIMANKVVVEPVAEEVPAVVSVAGEGKVALASDEAGAAAEEGKKTKKKKKKDD